MLTVYGDIRSGNCLKVKWMLDRVGRDYRWVEVDIMSGGSRTPEFLAMSPAGQVPIIVLEDGRPLAQSNAILLHLAESTDVIPADAYDRARMMEWLFWEQYSHEPYVAVARFQRLYLGKTEVEGRIMQRGDAALDRLEGALTGRDWIVGEGMTLADIALVAYTRMAGDGGFDLSTRTATRAWIRRVEAALALEPYG
ncbi:Disulfide-bond oxidoreductase YfcG [Brevundimonas sp. NIBR10]|uniref:glutathione S-transferase family protein n=1 Tax=Brevundimonas sp. NIBR10 TaxID=3015997 RepID=UPI0022F17BC8|nr:glutathione S-transferase family protein [Brevundimonas sp. NIBR10]WGM46771.1 Disulfide-bond oxidoreductase YfcG [Brevundimonas sp. NIBR10]